MTSAGTQLSCRFLVDRPGFNLNVELEFPSEGISVIFGHSGSGKTTLLRCIAGLHEATPGFVRFNGEIWQDESHFVPTHKRGLGYVFQEASLFPHLSILKNLEYAEKRAAGKPVGTDPEHAIQLLGIGHLLDRSPAQLSGGERQRVAIARALLSQPRLLLMDEPLASLDHRRKQEIMPYLQKLKHELRLPILYVSHSAEEVAQLADHLVALDNGRVVAAGALEDTLTRIDFPIKLGEDAGAVIAGKVAERDTRWHLARIKFDGGQLWLRDGGQAVGEDVRVRVLARDISLSNQKHEDTSIVNVLSAKVLEIGSDPHPGMALARLQIGNTVMLARLTHRSVDHLGLQEGKPIWAQIKSVAII